MLVVCRVEDDFECALAVRGQCHDFGEIAKTTYRAVPGSILMLRAEQCLHSTARECETNEVDRMDLG